LLTPYYGFPARGGGPVPGSWRTRGMPTAPRAPFSAWWERWALNRPPAAGRVVAFYRAAERRPQAVMSKWLWPDAIEAVMGFSQSSCAADSGGNWQGALLPKVDAAFAAFLRAGSLAELQEESRNVQEVFMSELAYIPLCAPMETYAVAPGVDGFSPLEGTLYPYYGPVGVRHG